jgi:hypothetical protein
MPAPEECSCEYGIHCGEECSQPSCLCQGWHPSSEAKKERPRETRLKRLEIGHSSAALCVGSSQSRTPASPRAGCRPSKPVGSKTGDWRLAGILGSERLTELAENIIMRVRKRVICARCDCSLIRHCGLLGKCGAVERRGREDNCLLEKTGRWEVYKSLWRLKGTSKWPQMWGGASGKRFFPRHQGTKYIGGREGSDAAHTLFKSSVYQHRKVVDTRKRFSSSSTPGRTIWSVGRSPQLFRKKSQPSNNLLLQCSSQ